MYIKENFSVVQSPPVYYRLGTYGDRLWDEKGWLDASGASNGTATTDMGMPTNPMPLPTSDSSGVPKAVTSDTPSTPSTPTTTPANKPTDNVNSKDDDLIMGMTKKQLALGIGVGIIGGLLLFYGYKKFK
jgi:hypothetical protein